MNGGVSGLRAYRAANQEAQTVTAAFCPTRRSDGSSPTAFIMLRPFIPTNLFFNGVDIRHFVTEPLFSADCLNFDTDLNRDEKRSGARGISAYFAGFTDIDRETVLNDDDGS